MRPFLTAALFAAAAAVAAVAAVAQTPPAAGTQTPRPRQSQADVRVDSVIATINDSSILLSEVQTIAAGELRSLQQKRGRLSPSDIEAVFSAQLLSLIRKYQLAQSAKTLGLATPDQVEAWFRSQLELTKQDQIRDHGSYTEFGRALKDQGRTWQTVEREQRIEVMHDIARSLTVGTRLHQANLITPRMMREAFQQSRDYFQHPAMAAVTMVAFSGPDAAANAAQAAATWAGSPFTGREMAAKFPGTKSYPELDASGLGEEYAAIKQFGLQGPELAVSTPFDIGGSLFVAKVTRFRAASNGQFEDPTVQEHLRLLLDQMLTEEFLRDAQARANVRTEVWVSELLGGAAALTPRR